MSNPAASIKEQNKSAASSLLRRNVRKFMNNKLALLGLVVASYTATATDAPTMGLLPMPIRPIISTCAGTEEEPANCASECILPMVSVMP